MTKLVQISEILSGKAAGAVRVRGWVYRHRSSNKMAFIILRDGSGVIQCAVAKDKVSKKEWGEASSLYPESSVVELEGEVHKDKRAPGGFEVRVGKVKLITLGKPFPINKDQSVELLLDKRHLWVRSQYMVNALKVKHFCGKYAREFLDALDFIEIQPPLLGKTECEGGSQMFEVKYFRDKAFLSESGQLYSEAVIAGYPKVYVYAPAWRAEKSRTPRHTTEFWLLEPEMAFYSQEDNMKLQEELVTYIIHKLAKEQPQLLKAFGREPKELLAVKPPFKRLTYKQAVKLINKAGRQMKVGDSMGYEEEKVLMLKEKAPVFVTNSLRTHKPFYMPINKKDPETVNDADLLAPEGYGEIIGGSERVWTEKELLDNLEFKKMNSEPYKWYIELRTYGGVPHAGFGLGMERLVRWVLKLPTIRDAIPFPRTINRLTP